MTNKHVPLTLNLEDLRSAIKHEYSCVATEPQRGFHFHTGRPLAHKLDYQDDWLAGIPEASIDSFAGTGNPFRMGILEPGEKVVDVGCGAGIDSLIASRMVASEGKVIGVDMTPAMLKKARAAAHEAAIQNVEFRSGYVESLPVEDDWADRVISNGVLNLVPEKIAALREMARVLQPGGRLQISDILVQKEISEETKANIDLWTG
jgi:SAM-dependent methyltransferase